MKKTYLFIFTFLVLFTTSFSQETSEIFSFDNENRSYILYIPSTYNAATDNLPLVLALHGLGDTKENFNNGNGLKALAESENFILVTPQAEDPTESVTLFGIPVAVNTILQKAWHSGAGGQTIEFMSSPITLPTAYYVSETRDDVGFLSALIDAISNQYNVDSNRVYSTGFSMGGFMTNMLACQLSDKIAAIASVSGTIGNEIKNSCNPDAIIPALHIHSTDDQTVAYTNNSWGMDAEDNVDFWVANNNCNTTALTTDYTTVASDGFVSQKNLYTQGDSASEVEFYHLEGPDHVGSWYGGNNDFVTAEVIWEFFSKHEKVRVIDSIVIEDPLPNAIPKNETYTINIFPNPTTGITNLTFQDSKTIKQISLLNTIGKIITIKSFNGNTNSFTLDITNKPQGVYFIQIEDNSGNKRVEKLIKK